MPLKTCVLTRVPTYRIYTERERRKPRVRVLVGVASEVLVPLVQHGALNLVAAVKSHFLSVGDEPRVRIPKLALPYAHARAHVHGACRST
jgi:hypothetical protein